jgi:YVTN family beta-propeller protein
VYVIDGQTNKVTDTISVGQGPVGIAYDANNGNVFVSDINSDTVSVIDSTTNTVIGTIPVGNGLRGIVFNPNNNDTYVANQGSNTVSVIATTSYIQPPTATTITSATDGNGNPVKNDGFTASTSITFHVTTTQGTKSIAGFQSSLNGSSFSSCATSNPNTITYNNLAAGQHHTFKVRAVDKQGNIDTTPATFSWKVLTSKQAIQKLISTIDGKHLPKGAIKSLEAILNASIRQLNRNSDVAACNILDAFLHQVNAYEGSRLITSQQAMDLIQQATAIQHAL